MKRRLVLACSLVAASVVVPSATATAAAPVCGGVSVGPEQVVVPDATRDSLGLDGWSDTALGVLRDGPGNYTFLGVAAFRGTPQHPQSIAVTKGNLDNPVAGGVAHVGSVENWPGDARWAGGGPVYRDPQSGTVLQTLHIERHFDLQDPAKGYYSELHLGRFDPATGVTTDLGPVITPALDFETAKAHHWNADVGTSSLTVVDGYLRMHYPDYYAKPDNTPGYTSFSSARAPLADVLAAAKQGTVVKWSKFHDGAWNSPGLGGPSSDLRPNQTLSWHPSTVRTASGGLAMAFGTNPSEMRFTTTATDGTSGWAPEVPLLRDPDHFDAYPNLVGTGDDPSVLSNQFYLYYLQWANPKPDWANARIMRRTVTCTAGLPSGTTAFVRYTDGSRHEVTTGPVSDARMHPEQGGTWYLKAGETAGTKPLYECRLGARDHFVSLDAGCEGSGNVIKHTAGWIYTSPPAAPNTPLYRCHAGGIDDHYVSIMTDCEKAPGAKNEGLLGYALTGPGHSAPPHP
ncbi:hypothetical protein [Amycolatopsis minnesotensis]|uniref:Secreted protein n=1 Tax=Amycolatopsis minnesotensis TaxID=337894 RepID=A0ABN2QNB3_9PSEU